MGGGRSLQAAQGGPDANARAMQMERNAYDRRSQQMGPAPPTGVASYGVGPVDGDRMAAQMKELSTRGDMGVRDYMGDGAGGVGAAAGGVPSEAGEYDRQLSQVDVARGAADQQQEAADQPAPPPPAPQSSIQAMQGDRGMGRERLMQQMRQQQMMRRPYGRGRGPATY